MPFLDVNVFLTSRFMFCYLNENIPDTFFHYFKTSNGVHKHNKRQSSHWCSPCQKWIRKEMYKISRKYNLESYSKSGNFIWHFGGSTGNCLNRCMRKNELLVFCNEMYLFITIDLLCNAIVHHSCTSVKYYVVRAHRDNLIYLVWYAKVDHSQSRLATPMCPTNFAIPPAWAPGFQIKALQLRPVCQWRVELVRRGRVWFHIFDHVIFPLVLQWPHVEYAFLRRAMNCGTSITGQLRQPTTSFHTWPITWYIKGCLCLFKHHSPMHTPDW